MLSPDQAQKLANVYGKDFPRHFKVLVAGEEQKGHFADELAYIDLGDRISFGRYQKAGGAIKLNQLKIPATAITYSPVLMTYTWDCVCVGIHTAGHLDLKSEHPAGHITVADNTYMVMLEAVRSEYGCAVAADAGAVWSSGQGGFVWDAAGAAWKNAAWDPTLTFAFDVKWIERWGEKMAFVENYFKDLGENCYAALHSNFASDLSISSDP
jgi:hypothetical protein